MKTCIQLIVLVLLVVGNYPANAQGVIHIGQGDSYLFSQPLPTDIQNAEGIQVFVTLQVGFSGDLFAQGENMQLDIYSSPTSLTPLTTGTITNSTLTSLTGTQIGWVRQPWQPWNAATGAVRLTMLSGSVDVSGASVTTCDSRTIRSYSYTIPEPSVPLLLTPGLLYLFLRHRKI